jgi:hypothetical protein
MQQAHTIMALEDARATNQKHLPCVGCSSAFNMLDQDKLLQIMFDPNFRYRRRGAA